MSVIGQRNRTLKDWKKGKLSFKDFEKQDKEITDLFLFITVYSVYYPISVFCILTYQCILYTVLSVYSVYCPICVFCILSYLCILYTALSMYSVYCPICVFCILSYLCIQYAVLYVCFVYCPICVFCVQVFYCIIKLFEFQTKKLFWFYGSDMCHGSMNCQTGLYGSLDRI